MSDWKAERLSSFMEITGIEDSERALTILEKYKWDLNNAVTAVVDNKSDSDVEIIEESSTSSSSRKTRKSEENQSKRTTVPKAGSSSSSHYTSRSANFSSRRESSGNGGGSSGSSSVSSGRSSRSHRSSLDSGNSSGIANNNLLSNSRRSKSIIFEKPKKCTFLIHDKNKLKTYNMDYKWDVTVQKVKNDVYSLTDIPVGNQIWQGWPDYHTNDSKLSELNLTLPVHELSVSARYLTNDRFATGVSATMTSSAMAASLASTPNATITSGSFAASYSSKNDPITVQAIDSDDSEEYDYSMENDEAIFKNISNKDPLISDNIESEVVGSLEFSKQFENRYGPCHPDFYVGSLEDAMKHACAKPVKERKILAIYLHHDKSVLSNVFCSQLLGCEAVLQMFQENFVVWGWDVTFDSNRRLLIESISERLGSAGFAAIRTMPINRFPLTVLIMQNRSSTEIHTIIYGDVNVNELSSRLIEAVDVFNSYQNKELRDEEERNARELVKLEQDIAFNESLQNDRAKEEARHKQAALELEKQQKQIEEIKEKQRKFEQEQNLARMRLAPEPPATTAQSDVCFFRFKSPTNDVLERRFLRKSKINSIFDFLIINGFSIEDYKVLLNWPKRDLTTFDPLTMLEDLKLNRQEVAILEKR